MESLSTSAEPVEVLALETVPTRPRPYRHGIHRLAYVNLDHANGGIIRNLSETGIALQAVAPLRVAQQVHIRFELMSPRVRVDTLGKVCWADSFGQAGVQFLNLPQRTRRILKEWIFTQLLASSHRGFEDSIFLPTESAVELLFSSTPRPTICLDSSISGTPHLQDSELVDEDAMVRFLWCPVAISAGSLSWLIDSLILLSAVLLFLMVSLVLTHALPAWTVVAALALGVACLFTTLYWFLFTIWMGATPGACLVERACVNSEGGTYPEQDRPRFR
jgi:PilZ domain-containing protein